MKSYITSKNVHLKCWLLETTTKQPEIKIWKLLVNSSRKQAKSNIK